MLLIIMMMMEMMKTTYVNGMPKSEVTLVIIR